MVNKRNSGNGGKTTGHSAITHLNRPAGILSSKRNRYAHRYLTLAIMGGAAFFLVKGCSDSGSSDNDGDGTFYTTVQECADDGNNYSVCAEAWNHAHIAFEATLPRQMTRENCEQQFGNCYVNNGENNWMPVMAGFLLGQAIRNDPDESYLYHSGGTSYVSRPVWRTSSGDYSWRSGSDKRSTAASHGYTTKKATTVSRGGYGRSSSARGHWGG